MEYFCSEYHPHLNSLYGIIRKNIYLLNLDQKVKEQFSSRPVVSFRSTINGVAIQFEQNFVLLKRHWVYTNFI